MYESFTFKRPRELVSLLSSTEQPRKKIMTGQEIRFLYLTHVSILVLCFSLSDFVKLIFWKVLTFNITLITVKQNYKQQDYDKPFTVSNKFYLMVCTTESLYWTPI